MGGYAVNEDIVHDRRQSMWESQYYFVSNPNRCDDATLHVPRPIPDLVCGYMVSREGDMLKRYVRSVAYSSNAKLVLACSADPNTIQDKVLVGYQGW